MTHQLSALFDREGKNIREWRVIATLVQADACTWKLTYFIRGAGSHNFRQAVERHDLPLTAVRGSFQSITEQAMRLIKAAALDLTKIPSHQLGIIASVWTPVSS
jgi:hypothetical protein